ncbi:MAG: hypothetical protein D6715_10410 [Calditrichaeota bacterium]|nr:MAG: hypothetical protein D6715_10410 [Calditrichota bacterium]
MVLTKYLIFSNFVKRRKINCRLNYRAIKKEPESYKRMRAAFTAQKWPAVRFLQKHLKDSIAVSKLFCSKAKFFDFKVCEKGCKKTR